MSKTNAKPPVTVVTPHARRALDTVSRAALVDALVLHELVGELSRR